MLTARSIRNVLAVAGVLTAVSLTGANAASIPATSPPAGETGIIKVEHSYCYKGRWYVPYCKKWGYDGYGNKYCRKWGHKRQGYCGGSGGGYGGGSY